jgi:hypothetical protein
VRILEKVLEMGKSLFSKLKYFDIVLFVSSIRYFFALAIIGGPVLMDVDASSTNIKWTCLLH